jgi:hypothetical protein
MRAESVVDVIIPESTPAVDGLFNGGFELRGGAANFFTRFWDKGLECSSNPSQNVLQSPWPWSAHTVAASLWQGVLYKQLPIRRSKYICLPGIHTIRFGHSTSQLILLVFGSK